MRQPTLFGALMRGLLLALVAVVFPFLAVFGGILIGLYLGGGAR